MKFKPLYVSLLALGLVSGSALAGTTKDAKHAQVTKTYAVVNQNSAVNALCVENWASRIFIGGLLNVDALWGNHSPISSFTRNNHGSDIVVNNANLFVDANINSWVKAHMNLEYIGHRHNLYQDGRFDADNSYGHKFGVDEAYLTVADFAKSPLYLRAGKQYVAYGDYERYPMVKSLTQIMTQTNATAVAIGAVTDFGVYFNAFAFNGPTTRSPAFTRRGGLDKMPNIENFGAKLGYYGTLPAFGLNNTHYNIDVSYIRDMHDVDAAVASAPYFYPHGLVSYESPLVGIDPVGGVAAHFDLSHGPIDFVANYVTALKNLVKFDGCYTGPYDYTIHSSKLRAGELTGGYSFKLMNHDSKVGLSYQWSNNGEFTAYNSIDMSTWFAPNAQYVSLPKSRWMLDYQVNLLQHTDLGLALVHDKSYTYSRRVRTDEGRRTIRETRESNTALARLSVQF